MKRLLFTILHCTWGLPQTLLGLVIFLINRRCPHGFYLGVVDTRWKSRGGMSLGLFIFTPPEEDSRSQPVRIHEYGHTFQALLLGPLYLVIVGIPSYLWANLPVFIRMRREKKIPYTSLFVESWASRLGEKATGKRASWN